MSSRIKNLIVSFRNAARGVAYCVNNERNMRIHIVIACYIVLFSRFFSLTQAQFALMLCAIALVIAMEMINTAVEVLVNIASPSYSALARVAKDVAAGAVLVCAAFAFAIG
ncbi:MAG: diacylglycerol kinase family protein, partial [Hydrogenoanaerobacterium sp.]